MSASTSVASTQADDKFIPVVSSDTMEIEENGGKPIKREGPTSESSVVASTGGRGGGGVDFVVETSTSSTTNKRKKCSESVKTEEPEEKNSKRYTSDDQEGYISDEVFETEDCRAKEPGEDSVVERKMCGENVKTEEPAEKTGERCTSDDQEGYISDEVFEFEECFEKTLDRVKEAAEQRLDETVTDRVTEHNHCRATPR